MDNRIVSIPAQASLENKILKNVYLWMSGGLALTGVIAMGVAGSPQLVRAIFSNPLVFYGLIIAELVLVFFFSARVMSLSPMAAVATFTAVRLSTGSSPWPVWACSPRSPPMTLKSLKNGAGSLEIQYPKLITYVFLCLGP